eukprot:COSAG02_NODE_1463_length_12488_cov_7.312591_17_plen_95_part_00
MVVQLTFVAALSQQMTALPRSPMPTKRCRIRRRGGSMTYTAMKTRIGRGSNGSSSSGGSATIVTKEDPAVRTLILAGSSSGGISSRPSTQRQSP